MVSVVVFPFSECPLSGYGRVVSVESSVIKSFEESKS